ncbi:hypothetical protein LX32DRAFT_116565 [Colletotrichum zoysiae]|uniref:Uncharacterized protein n=1 Tax=Colletotrichum zoysiae TaxID=1216348 RepID=A0AAD9M8V5_9PEZI|nr:hypothetical protein LX32DRAFT_116565 [Colletotrichum zoysiae]
MLDPGETQLLSHLSRTPPLLFLYAFASHHSSLEMFWTEMTLRGPSGVRRRGVDTLGRPGRWTCLMLSCSSWCGPPIYAGRRRRHVFQPNYIDARQEKDEKRNEKKRKGSTYTAPVRTVSGIPVSHSDLNHWQTDIFVPNHAMVERMLMPRIDSTISSTDNASMTHHRSASRHQTSFVAHGVGYRCRFLNSNPCKKKKKRKKPFRKHLTT